MHPHQMIYGRTSGPVLPLRRLRMMANLYPNKYPAARASILQQCLRHNAQLDSYVHSFVCVCVCVCVRARACVSTYECMNIDQYIYEHRCTLCTCTLCAYTRFRPAGCHTDSASRSISVYELIQASKFKCMGFRRPHNTMERLV